jgi:hypothetical protein
MALLKGHDSSRLVPEAIGTRGRAIPAALAAAVSMLAAPAIAQDIRLSGGACGQPVHLVAHEAPLSRVLQRLADAQRFTLAYRSDDDPLITTDERLPVTDLVRRLARNVNFSLEQTKDPRCPRVAMLAILPDGTDNGRPKPQKKPSWQTPEYERIAKQTMSDYLQSHGLPDQPAEELVVR